MTTAERLAQLEHDLEVARTERNVMIERVETMRERTAELDAKLASREHALDVIEKTGALRGGELGRLLAAGVDQDPWPRLAKLKQAMQSIRDELDSSHDPSELTQAIEVICRDAEAPI